MKRRLPNGLAACHVGDWKAPIERAGRYGKELLS
jgi:hypothetical protein